MHFRLMSKKIRQWDFKDMINFISRISIVIVMQDANKRPDGTSIDTHMAIKNTDDFNLFFIHKQFFTCFTEGGFFTLRSRRCLRRRR